MRILFTNIFLFLSTFCMSAIKNYKFHTMSPPGGFYYDGVKSILSTEDGFIWTLMDNNIQRFDGYEYKDYYPYFRSLMEDTKWQFNNFSMDQNHNLYVATNKGLYAYNRLTDSFKNIYDYNIANHAFDSKNNIWLVQNQNLLRYNINEKKADTLMYQNKPVRNINLICPHKDNMFVCTRFNRIYHYDSSLNADSLSLFQLFPLNYVIINIKIFNSKLWVLSNKEILKINIATNTIEYSFPLELLHPGLKSLKNFHIDKYNQIWLATQQGIYVIDSTTNEYKKFEYNKTDNFSITSSSVWCIAEDAHQDLWLGTYSGGLCYVNLNETRWFKTINTQDTKLSHNVVSAFTEDENNLWVGTEGGGLNIISKEDNSFTKINHIPDIRNNFPVNNIKSMCIDSKKNLWIATFREGLIQYNTQRNQLKKHQSVPRRPDLLLSNNLRKIVLDGDSGLWLAYQLDKTTISFFSFKDESYTHYNLDTDDKYKFILDLCKDNNGDIWAITGSKLYKLCRQTSEATDVSSAKIPYLNAQTIHIDKQENIWIGTIGNGLTKYEPITREFTQYKKITEGRELSIFSICSDNDDFLWLGTNKGLYRYNPRDNSYTGFNEKDGIQGNVFYPLATMKSNSGLLYLGGTSGLTIINPQNMHQNLYKPKVIISDFYINNNSNYAILGSELFASSNRKITLNHNQANFGFKLSTDSYLIPEKNQYKYRLKGYDNNWITTEGAFRTVMFSKVPPGTYHFEVMAANNDGLWNDVPTSVCIKRLPAPWLSWQAYTVYLLILLSIIGMILYYINTKRKLEMELYLDKLDKEKKEEIHQSQLRFFTNISHDFRTPLSLILAALDNLKKDGIKDYYYQILNNNAQRLLNLANELLDFRTIENGKMKLQVGKIDINHLIKTLSFDFLDYSKKRNIEFKYICDEKIDRKLLADKQILEKIIMNLLNNAFKYTKDGGRITIESYMDKQKFVSSYSTHFTVSGDHEYDDNILIVIRDNGVGISEQSIKSVFERFYKIDSANPDKHPGSGIGLALVKSLVTLHKGSISIYSEKEKGTDMVVSLPIRECCYSDTEKILSEEMDKSYKISQPMVDDIETIHLKNMLDTKMEDVMLRDKRQILVVEDNYDLRQLIIGFLGNYYEIKEAENGVEAVSIINNTEIDLILSDIRMPLKDGITLCKEIKNDINTSHIPFIMLTAKTGNEAKLEGADSGADLYLEKPIDLNLLLLSIQNIFDHQQKIREYYARNFYVDSAELSANEHDNTFLKQLIDIIDANLTQSDIDVTSIASQLAMSRSKLYSKLKTLTNKSIVEFILNYRMRKAARLIIEEEIPMYQVMDEIGIKSQSYFIKSFKKEFGDTPSNFAIKNRKKPSTDYEG